MTMRTPPSPFRILRLSGISRSDLRKMSPSARQHSYMLAVMNYELLRQEIG